MTDELKKVRKGTKSCTECRRRKVRCTWSSDEAPKCRRCEERGSNCIAQIYSIQTSTGKRLTSRDRIARLEQQVSKLHKALQAEDGGTTHASEVHDTTITEEHADSDSESSDFGSNESDGFMREPPAHLQTLFENDLISSDQPPVGNHDHQRSKIVSDLSTAVRRKLQELIPPKKEVDVIAAFASQWLSLFHALFPAPSIIKSGQEMVAQYDAVTNTSIDPAYLASWLLSIAMTIHQVPKSELGPEDEVKGFRNAAQFSKTVADAVEASIMRHDVLLGTVQGIDAALLYLRLQLTRGHFKKTWIQLRRVIAIAELIGLHRAARRADPASTVAQEGNWWPDVPHNSNARKAQVWESLCSVDRIAGMMFNLPPGTRRYRLPQNNNILENGKISPRAYFASLSEIAMKVQDMDDLDMPQYADAELYASVLKIDGELRVLSSLVPAAWWNRAEILSEQLLQYWHFYITIRVHLPFTLRHDTSEQYSFSRLACMKACQTLVQRYLLIRDRMPGGFFLCRVVDLQAFTALVVLCLAYHAANPTERANLHAQGGTPPEILIPQVVEFMKTVAHLPASDFARQAVDAVSSLTQLLHNDTTADGGRDLSLKVPLLGKLHVRRKRPSMMPAAQQQPKKTPSMQTNGAPISNPENSSLTSGQPHAGSDVLSNVPQEDYAWDPLSWSIEDDQVGVFQDAFMAEDFSPYGPWWDQTGMQFAQ